MRQNLKWNPRVCARVRVLFGSRTHAAEYVVKGAILHELRGRTARLLWRTGLGEAPGEVRVAARCAVRARACAPRALGLSRRVGSGAAGAGAPPAAGHAAWRRRPPCASQYDSRGKVPAAINDSRTGTCFAVRSALADEDHRGVATFGSDSPGPQSARSSAGAPDCAPAPAPRRSAASPPPSARPCS